MMLKSRVRINSLDDANDADRNDAALHSPPIQAQIGSTLPTCTCPDSHLSFTWHLAEIPCHVYDILEEPSLMLTSEV
ncbi:hypothetical protein V6N11_044704 [Hibiscus sabdariffa]|uniref:Uncharacterized protein n=1 Tax=Hibiscus sabdariffa TaxID=183260 RepID=A0ABR2PU56_9ROSI